MLRKTSHDSERIGYLFYYVRTSEVKLRMNGYSKDILECTVI